ncbi:MAG TPA: hypothetical protein VMV01_15705, partial [Planctomycetota bacterium]|nr:hypothetical protein [Planctomycetota bacterium]
SKLRGRVWVASFVDAGCLGHCPSAAERLAALHDGLPDGVPLVTFVLGGQGQWPSRPQNAAGRNGWIVCQGNATDAADERAVLELAADFLRVPREHVAGLARGEPAAIALAIDRRGGARKVRILNDEGAIRAAVGDAALLSDLHRHPVRDAVAYVVVALLLLGRLAGARVGLPQIERACAGGGSVLTMLLVISMGQAVSLAAAGPFHGAGWARLPYLAALGALGAASAAMTGLGLTLAYPAAPGPLARIGELAERCVPAWIATAVTGTAVCVLLRAWVGAG